MNPRLRSRILTGAFLAMAATLAWHTIYDPDFWYHLAAGERMLQSGAVLRQNFFSYTYPEQPWLDVYWLYQLALGWLWSWGQAAAVVGFKALLNLGLAGLVVWGLRDRERLLGPVEAMVLLLGWLVMLPRLTDRPELVSYVLLAAMLVLLRRRSW